jgi:hypothetical protein
VQNRADALVVGAEPFFIDRRVQIVTLATRALSGRRIDRGRIIARQKFVRRVIRQNCPGYFSPFSCAILALLAATQVEDVLDLGSDGARRPTSTQHMLAVCKPSGMVVTVMPRGVLFRGGSTFSIT